MFANLSDQELSNLYSKILSGRERAWRSGASANDSIYAVVTDASSLLRDIRSENQSR